MTGILSHIFPSFALYHPAKKVYENNVASFDVQFQLGIGNIGTGNIFTLATLARHVRAAPPRPLLGVRIKPKWRQPVKKQTYSIHLTSISSIAI
jgi:hypothetical protein